MEGRCGIAYCGEKEVAGLFLWSFLQSCSFSLTGISMKMDCMLTCVVWDGAANSQNEFTVTVENVTSATRGSIKPVPSKLVLPDECIL